MYMLNKIVNCHTRRSEEIMKNKVEFRVKMRQNVQENIPFPFVDYSTKAVTTSTESPFN